MTLQSIAEACAKIDYSTQAESNSRTCMSTCILTAWPSPRSCNCANRVCTSASVQLCQSSPSCVLRPVALAYVSIREHMSMPQLLLNVRYHPGLVREQGIRRPHFLLSKLYEWNWPAHLQDKANVPGTGPLKNQFLFRNTIQGIATS